MLRVFYFVKSGVFCAASPSVFKPFTPHIIVLLLTHFRLKVNQKGKTQSLQLLSRWNKTNQKKDAALASQSSLLEDDCC